MVIVGLLKEVTFKGGTFNSFMCVFYLKGRVRLSFWNQSSEAGTI